MPDTPPLDPRRGGVLTTLLKSRRLAWVLARIGIGIAHWWGRPFRLGKTIIVVRHRDVADILARDLDYLIAPVNGPRFVELGFPFILGMDRADVLVRERAILYRALAGVDFEPMRAAAASDVRQRLADHPAEIDVIGDLARPVAAATAGRLVGLALPPTDLMALSRPLFEHAFLNPGNDPAVAAKARAAAARLSDALGTAIATRRALVDPGDDFLGNLLRAGADDDLTRRTLAGMFVGSIDTTATVTAKSLWVITSRPDWLTAATHDIDNPERLYGWCCEALRRWTHVPVLTRRASGASLIAGTRIDDGANVVMWIQAAMADASAFDNPGAMRPDRPQRAYLHLGGGLHPCAGRAITAWQVPLLVGGVLGRDVNAIDRIVWSGPFPDAMRVRLGVAHA